MLSEISVSMTALRLLCSSSKRGVVLPCRWPRYRWPRMSVWTWPGPILRQPMRIAMPRVWSAPTFSCSSGGLMPFCIDTSRPSARMGQHGVQSVGRIIRSHGDKADVELAANLMKLVGIKDFDLDVERAVGNVDIQPFLTNRADMFLVDVDESDIRAGARQPAADDAANGAGADNDHALHNTSAANFSCRKNIWIGPRSVIEKLVCLRMFQTKTPVRRCSGTNKAQ